MQQFPESCQVCNFPPPQQLQELAKAAIEANCEEPQSPSKRVHPRMTVSADFRTRV